ncbi:MAG: lactate utilization protein C [Rhodospirillaceae bacterium]|nr:lactate utilization protein C [Rhodospirillaceae bacterium]MDD9915656.1 lactate utilization protein C [Rhodospirillaceae bacterium]MDD9924731.1 lactate utilization protein C [Rhodospirillaceae bacterium]
MSGRESILGAIRQGLGRGALGTAEQDALEDRIAGHARGIRPGRVETADLKQMFVDYAAKVDVTVDRVASLDDVPDKVADYLAQENLPAELRVAPDPALDTVPWDKRPTLTVSKGASDGTHEVGLTAAFAGIAETGTLMMKSGPAHPTTLNFLPDTHVVVLRASQIVGSYEDAWDRLRADEAMPRTVNFITGPSRTGDIEQTIFLGAHGPRRMHIVLVEDD